MDRACLLYTSCACGKHHACDLRIFKSGAGVIAQVPQVIAALGCKYPYLVCDPNTHKAAGAQVEQLLKAANIPYKLFIIPREKVEPDEWAVGAVTMAMDPRCCLLYTSRCV